MKIQLLILAAAALALGSCVPLAGTALSFDSAGNAMITAQRPIIIPAK